MAALTLVRAYQHSFDTRPNITLAVTGGSLNAFGDVVAQFAEPFLGRRADPEYHVHRYDFVRTFRFFCFGFTISPFLGRWNAFLESRFPLYTRTRTRTPHSSSTTTTTNNNNNNNSGRGRGRRGARGAPRISFLALAKRVAADQLIMAPIGLLAFLTSMGLMEGRTRTQVAQKCRALYAPTLLANWRVWPLAQLVNLGAVPLAYRVPAAQAGGVLWTLYLSLVNAREDERQDREAALIRDRERLLREEREKAKEIEYESESERYDNDRPQREGGEVMRLRDHVDSSTPHAGRHHSSTL